MLVSPGIIELRAGKGTHSLSGILNIDAKRSIINPRFNNNLISVALLTSLILEKTNPPGLF